MKPPPYFSFHHFPERGTVYSQWFRTVDSGEYRQALLSVCELIRSSNANNWLVDLSKTSSPTISDQNWTSDLLGHNLQQTHLRKIAFVLPNDLFLEVVTEKVSTAIIKLTNNEIQIARFSDLTIAEQWLDSTSDFEGLFRNDSTVSA